MKYLLSICLLLLIHFTFAQSLQLHYDLRHTVRPGLNTKNFPTLYFEYFKPLDSVKSPIKLGSFLLKAESDFMGEQSNIGKYYMQVSQEFRVWAPPVFLDLQYSGGLGITTPRQYSYYILNTYAAGASYHFKLGGAFLSSVLFFRYAPYTKPSRDFLYTLYYYKGFWNYKAELAGDFSIWTENKNHGDSGTIQEHGKRFFFFAEPQFWYNLNSTFSLGTKWNTYYHVNFSSNQLELYPTVALRLKFH